MENMETALKREENGYRTSEYNSNSFYDTFLVQMDEDELIEYKKLSDIPIIDEEPNTRTSVKSEDKRQPAVLSYKSSPSNNVQK